MIHPLWSGHTAVCIGGGPSLTQADVDYCKGRAKVIAINDAYRLAPWADLLYACDLKWWQWHEAAVRFHHNKWTCDREAANAFGLNYIVGANGDGLSTDADLIHYGQNSGYQAINMAYHLGASRVLLLGYDMGANHSGKTHWFGDHPVKTTSPYQAFIKNFRTIADQGLIEIINCSRRTAMQVFAQAAIEDVL